MIDVEAMSWPHYAPEYKQAPPDCQETQTRELTYRCGTTIWSRRAEPQGIVLEALMFLLQRAPRLLETQSCTDNGM